MRRVVAAVAGLLLLAAPAARAVDPVAARQRLMERYGPAIVHVEAVLKTKFSSGGQGQEQESRIELLGAVVDPSGLVMIWNSHISSARMSELMGQMGRSSGFGVDIAPTDFRVHFEAEDEDVRAFLAAADSALDLAFLQLEDEGDTPRRSVSFAEVAEPQIGEEVVALGRLGRSFDFAPYSETARVGGRLRKPRAAWILDGELGTLGLPVFALSGQPIGVLTTVLSRAASDPEAALGVRGMMGSLFGGGNDLGPLGAFVLPGARVRSLIAQGRKQAAELVARRAAFRASHEHPPEGR